MYCCAASVCIYLLLATEFLVRYTHDKPVRPVREGAATEKRVALDRGMKLMLLALALAGVCILIRSIYRTIVSRSNRCLFFPI